MGLVSRDATMIIMLRKRMRKIEKKLGFTLLEIMVAVSIMMIISGVSLASFTFSQRKSRDAKRKSDLSQIARALQVFNEDFGRYPLDVNGEIIGCHDDDESDELEDCAWGDVFAAYPNATYQLYMSKLPEDPKGGYEYYYVSDGDNFNLYAGLENENDKDYRSDLTEDWCGVTCSYLLTEYGVEVE